MLMFGSKQCINYFNIVPTKKSETEEVIDLSNYEYTTDGNGVATTSKYIGSETEVVMPKSKSSNSVIGRGGDDLIINQ